MSSSNIEKPYIVTKCIVGSRLHGLNTESSDYDFRGVHISSLRSILSPYIRVKNTNWQEGSIDDVSYELYDFINLLTRGNPTALEVLFSQMTEVDTHIAQKMRRNWHRFIDTEALIKASRGYAHNQWNKFYNYDDVGEKNQLRTAKFAIAFLRVMWQCEQFLLTGKFMTSVISSDYYDLMKKIKPLTATEIQKYLPEIVAAMTDLNLRVSKAMKNDDILSLKPDYEWINDFIYHSYKSIDEMQTAPTLDNIMDDYEKGLISASELHNVLKKRK